MIDFDPETSLYNPYPGPLGGVYSYRTFTTKKTIPAHVNTHIQYWKLNTMKMTRS